MFPVMRCFDVDEEDFTEGLENFPVYGCNREVISKKTSKYITKNVRGPGISTEDFETTIMGCRCLECDKDCTCTNRYGEGYRDYHLKEEFLNNTHVNPIFECNSNCSCLPTCHNRIIQHGIKQKLEIFDSPEKGLCLRILQNVEKGHFICQYAGEIISYHEAQKRTSMLEESDMNYILSVREHCASGPVETIVDPTHFGNIGRYINHSCEPNLVTLPVRIDSVIPVIALFACRYIDFGEELTFDYGSSRSESITSKPDQSNTSQRKLKECHCGSDICKGYLPFHSYLFE